MLRLHCALALAMCLVILEGTYAQDRGIADFPKLDATKDWPFWRGPNRDGHAAKESRVPVEFGESQNVRWKVPVPGRGHSSPIVVGNRVFITTADETQQIQSVLAYDRAEGLQLWKIDLNQGGFPANNHPKNTEATPTIAADGERLFVVFVNHKQVHLTALGLDGSTQWKQVVGPFDPKRFEYGYAPSPLLYGSSVIVAAEHDGDSAIAAFSRQSGEPIWRAPRPSSISFSTPVVAHVGGRDQLLISGQELVCSYDPTNGRQLWQTAATTFATCGTMVWDNELVFASGGYPKAGTFAIRPDGSGKVIWQNNQKCYEQSMIVVDGYLYALTDNGIMYCWRSKDGQEMWRQRLAGPVSASPVLAGGYIYWSNEAGTCYVLKPNPAKYEAVAENKLGTEAFASPAVSGSELFVRVAFGQKPNRQEFLYCIGNQR
jgi:outer membrane protein assembly factor BamB